ncbi:MAG TPA: peroxiredoxin [Candidatus Ozemobacteraceae bacterium]|nr:peroxiredoxin [Candidatus Ozemobacteraceae bacterium]HQG27381.1 peroxiredoxin [Candidatus Ozemobacteraceae bacterium]
MNVGDRAPEFTLNDQDGKPVSLADFRGRQTVVVFFYPKDESPVCTIEACGFRDMTPSFTEVGAAVLGISSDNSEKHRAFADQYRLSFPLLADTDGAVRRAFGVPSTLWLFPGRVTYVIDRDGIVRMVYDSPIRAQQHVERALEAARSLAPKP